MKEHTMKTIDTHDLARVTGGNPFGGILGGLRNLPGLGGLLGGGPTVGGNSANTGPGSPTTNYNSGSVHGSGSINVGTQAPPPTPAPQ
jgi:hypothetical protein